MSGLFLTNGDNAMIKRAAERLSFTPDTWRMVGSIGACHFAVTRVDAQRLWAPAHDPRTGVRLLLGGRVAFDSDEWSRAEDLPFQGGLAPRLLLDRYLADADRFISRANGAFAIIILDPRDSIVRLFTDRLGVYPLYESLAGPFCISSHPDVLADFLRDQNAKCELDTTTLAEFIATGTSVQPYTYYRQIRQLEPASVYRWRLPERNDERHAYWAPSYLKEAPSSDAEAMIQQLAGALTNAARRRTQARLGRPLIMLSGGADSRAALFGSVAPNKAACITLFDEENEELKTAQRLARLAGAEHRPIKRDSDYYGVHAQEAMKVAGGMWNLVDAHYTGIRSAVAALNPGTILTGCYADYMFKGLLQNRTHRTLLGWNLPLFNAVPFSFQFYQPFSAVTESFQRLVQARLEERFPGHFRADSEECRLAMEDLRLRPLSREPDSSGRLYLWRTMPWDHLLSDTDVLAVYGRLSVGMKLNGIVFGKAVGRLIGKAAARIPNNNYATPVDASEATRALWFCAGVVKRKVRRAVRQSPSEYRLATTGSWPNWCYYLGNSPALASTWMRLAPNAKELFHPILGYDYSAVSPREWSFRDVPLFTRLVSALVWLHSRKFIE